MRASIATLRVALRALLRGLRLPGLYLLLLLSFLAWLMAYQQKSLYTVDVGGLLDRPYISGFHAQEKTVGFDYRWTMSRAVVRFPAIGNEPVQLSITTSGSRPNLPPPVITVTVRGLTFPLQTKARLNTDTFFVPRGDAWNGDLTVGIAAPTFNEGTAAKPGRDLGVTVERVVVAPANNGLRPVVVPAVYAVGEMLLGLLLFMFSALAATRSPLAMQIVGAVLGMASTFLIVTNRLDLGLLAPELPGLGLWCLLLAVVGRTLLDTLLDDGTPQARFVAGAGAAAFVLAFALRFGGMDYPQFRSSDLILNVHNVESILRGDWLIFEPLPDGTPAPYPPALYLVIAPITALFGGSEGAIVLLLKWTMSVLDASASPLLAYTGYRLWRGAAGGWAALVYSVLLASFELFSAGNYTNLFAQGTLHFAMLGGLVYLNLRRARSGRAGRLLLLITAAFFLTLLGHYGMMLSTLAVAGPFALWVVAETVRGRRPAAAWRLLGSLGLALVAAVALYYRNVLDVIANHFERIFERLTGQPVLQIGGGVPVTTPAPSPGERISLLKLGGKVARLVGTAPFLLGGAAGVLGLAPMSRAARAWLGSWLLVTALFALLDQALGDTVRWYYLGAAALALLAGRYLAVLTASVPTRPARWFVTLVLLAMLWQLLYIWVGDLIFFRYHDMP